jgi:hypothetical protein
MKVGWLNKWMIISHNGSSVQMHGLQPILHEYSLIEVMLVSEASADLVQDQLPTLSRAFCILLQVCLRTHRTCHLIDLVTTISLAFQVLSQ